MVPTNPGPGDMPMKPLAARILGVGLVTKQSAYPLEQTVSRLEQAARLFGAAVLSRIDHRSNAKQEGLALRPTELLIFGKPRVSTPLMQAQQTAGVDLPLKALVWRDADGAVWVTYNDIAYLALRHGITDQGDAIASMHDWFDAVVRAIVS
jgi:uncharacterized protein (DUF302 family)